MKMRRLLIGVVGLGLLLVGLAGGVFVYLGSSAGAARVAQQLEAMTGAPVEVGSFRPGIRRSTIRDLRLLDPSTRTPWASVESTDVDIPLWDLALGSLPQRLTLSNVHLEVRFDKDGDLLTKLPRSVEGGGMPAEILIENGRLTLLQEGRSAFTLEGLKARVAGGEAMKLTGTLEDPRYGTWDVSIDRDQKSGVARWHAATAKVHVTPAMLPGLPFVPLEVWKEVQVEGDTSAELTLLIDPGKKDWLHYQVRARPQNATGRIARIDLEVRQLTGHIEIDDYVVKLRDVKGQAADGSAHLGGDLDFRTAPHRLTFHAKAEGLDVGRLPASWNLPRDIRGRLSGDANVQVTLKEDDFQVSGSGDGAINEATVAGLKADPIKLKLVTSKGRLRFASPGEGQGRAEAALGIVCLVGAQAEPTHPSLAGQALNRVADLVGQVGRSTMQAGTATARTGSQVIGWTARRINHPAAVKAEPTTYLEANLSLRDADLATLVKNLKVELPFAVKGRGTIRVKLSVPVNKPDEVKEYRLQGTVEMPWAELADLRVEEVTAKVNYRNGLLSLDALRGTVPAAKGETPGSVSGGAMLQVSPAGDLTAKVTLSRIPLARVATLTPGLPGPVGGRFSGDFEACVADARVTDVEAWAVKGTLTSGRLEVAGWSATGVETKLQVQKGELRVSSLGGRAQTVPFRGDGRLVLAAPYAFTGELRLTSDEKTDLRGLPVEVPAALAPSGSFALVANAKGTLSPLQLDAAGTGSASDFKLGKAILGTVTFDWESNLDRLLIRTLRTAYRKGELTGSAVLPYRPTIAGSIDLAFTDLDVAALSRDLPDLPLKLEGIVTGTVTAEMAATRAGQPREPTARLDLQSGKLRLQNIPADRVQGEFNYRKGEMEYRLAGETLGGKFEVMGKVPAAPAKSEGRLRIDGVRLGRLSRVMQLPALQELRGIVDVDVTYNHEGPDGYPVGKGRATLSRLRWGSTALSERLAADIVLDGRQVRVRSLTGTFAQGNVAAQLALPLRGTSHGWFNVFLESVDVRTMLAPWPELASRAEGHMNLRMRGAGAREWRGNGTVSMTRGVLGGLDVVDGQVPFTFHAVPGLGRYQLDARDINAQAGHGRTTGQVSVGWTGHLQIEGNLRFHGLDLSGLANPSSALGGAIAGRLCGRVEFKGSDVRSLNDLTATLQASFQKGPVGRVPVLQDLARFLVPALSASSAFQSGDVRARLARGVVRVESLRLVGPSVQAFITGTVTIDGRLDLDVVANTGRLAGQSTGVRMLARRVPMIGPVPVALIVEANELIANRLIFLSINGTTRSPVIRVEVLRTLSEEAVRFFLSWAGGAAIGTDFLLVPG